MDAGAALPRDVGMWLAIEAGESLVIPFFKLQRRMSEYLPASLVPALVPAPVPALSPAPRLAAGKVWLIGAGPGDPELLTLKAARILGSADVILLDDLVNRAVLAHARTGARVIEVGKRAAANRRHRLLSNA